MPTPVARDSKGRMLNSRQGGDSRPDAVATLLPTPTTVNTTSVKAQTGRDTSGPHRGGASFGLEDVAVLLPTPTTMDGRDGTSLRGTTVDAATRGAKRGIGLNHLMEGSLPDGTPLLPTPAVNDMGAGKTPEAWDEWTDAMRARHGNGNGHGKSLEIEAQRLLPTPTSQAAKHGGIPDVNAHGYGSNLWDIPTLLPTPRATDGTKGGPNQRGSSGDLMLPSAVQEGRFGPYAAAIHRWGQVLGRPAPSPTEPGKDGRPRLSPRFVEHMMGLPDGWVCDTGIPRNAQLKALGNGVVPQQAALALSILLPRAEAAIAREWVDS